MRLRLHRVEILQEAVFSMAKLCCWVQFGRLSGTEATRMSSRITPKVPKSVRGTATDVTALRELFLNTQFSEWCERALWRSCSRAEQGPDHGMLEGSFSRM
jgi:hypothetical protein